MMFSCSSSVRIGFVRSRSAMHGTKSSVAFEIRKEYSFPLSVTTIILKDSSSGSVSLLVRERHLLQKKQVLCTVMSPLPQAWQTYWSLFFWIETTRPSSLRSREAVRSTSSMTLPMSSIFMNLQYSTKTQHLEAIIPKAKYWRCVTSGY